MRLPIPPLSHANDYVKSLHHIAAIAAHGGILQSHHLGSSESPNIELWLIAPEIVEKTLSSGGIQTKAAKEPNSIAAVNPNHGTTSSAGNVTRCRDAQRSVDPVRPYGIASIDPSPRVGTDVVFPEVVDGAEVVG